MLTSFLQDKKFEKNKLRNHFFSMNYLKSHVKQSWAQNRYLFTIYRYIVTSYRYIVTSYRYSLVTVGFEK